MEKKNKEVDEGKAWAFIGVFLGIIGFVLVLLAKKENKYARYYATQGLVLTIAYVIIAIVKMIPMIGMFIFGIGLIILIILWIIGMVYALSGERKRIPLIGEFAEKLNV